MLSIYARSEHTFFSLSLSVDSAFWHRTIEASWVKLKFALFGLEIGVIWLECQQFEISQHISKCWFFSLAIFFFLIDCCEYMYVWICNLIGVAVYDFRFIYFCCCCNDDEDDDDHFLACQHLTSLFFAQSSIFFLFRASREILSFFSKWNVSNDIHHS